MKWYEVLPLIAAVIAVGAAAGMLGTEVYRLIAGG